MVLSYWVTAMYKDVVRMEKFIEHPVHAFEILYSVHIIYYFGEKKIGTRVHKNKTTTHKLIACKRK